MNFNINKRKIFMRGQTQTFKMHLLAKLFSFPLLPNSSEIVQNSDPKQSHHTYLAEIALRSHPQNEA